MDYKNIVNLMKEMNHTDLTKLEVEEEGVRICIEKAPKEAAPVQMQPTVMVQPGSLCTGAATEVQAEESNNKKVVSPMVGTFYTQPSPDKPPFVKVGDTVKKGQTVCIIEAMKLMNEIESDHDGEIVKILTQNEQMVEYGQPLFLIK